MKTHWKQAFDSPYLGSWDLEDYNDITLTIKEVKAEVTKGLKENSKMNVCYFKETNYKPMLLNVTNNKMIKLLTKTPYIEQWQGQRVTIFVQTGVKAFGELHDALRIRPVTTAKNKPELTPTSAKWETARTKVKAGMTFKELSKHYTITESNFKTLTQ